jgi:hypothetical protein
MATPSSGVAAAAIGTRLHPGSWGRFDVAGDTTVTDQPGGNTVTIAAGESIAVTNLVISDPTDTLEVDGTLTVSS